MATSRVSSVCARFDRFQVDLTSGDLRTTGGVCVHIQQQPLQVLRLLLEAEGKVVGREQLRAALWPDETFVDFEHGVNTAVRRLRQALEDSGDHSRFIETLPKVGYRFVAPVVWVANATDRHGLHSVVPIAPAGWAPASQVSTPKLNWKLTSLVALAVAVVCGIVAWALWRHQEIRQQTSHPHRQQNLAARAHG